MKQIGDNGIKSFSALLGVVIVGAMVVGCSTVSPEGRRAEYQKEFERLSALPPAETVQSSDPDLANTAKLSSDLFNEFQPMMKAYVAKTESSREYLGFMNDVQYYVKEEQMSEADACKKVADAVNEADANLPADQKVWPKIQKGILAARELDPKKQLVQIGVMVARNLEIGKSVQHFKDSEAFKNAGFNDKLARGAECKRILEQSGETGECLYFLQDQFTRVIELEKYAR